MGFDTESLFIGLPLLCSRKGLGPWQIPFFLLVIVPLPSVRSNRTGNPHKAKEAQVELPVDNSWASFGKSREQEGTGHSKL